MSAASTDPENSGIDDSKPKIGFTNWSCGPDNTGLPVDKSPVRFFLFRNSRDIPYLVAVYCMQDGRQILLHCLSNKLQQDFVWGLQRKIFFLDTNEYDRIMAAFLKKEAESGQKAPEANLLKVRETLTNSAIYVQK